MIGIIEYLFWPVYDARVEAILLINFSLEISL